MIKRLFVLVLCAMAFQVEASVDAYHEVRVEWVKEIKAFVGDLEKRNPELLTTDTGRQLLQKLSLFEEAYAAGNYDCFFAGWPSKLVKSGTKKLCQSPSRGNAEYQSGSCGKGQLQCQPLMFGQGLCVSFSSSQDKQLAFSTCESKFKKKGNYDFLKSLKNEEKTALKELSVLAHDICETGKVGVQKSKPMCKSLLSKFKNGLEAIDRAPATEEEVPVKEDEKVEPKEEPSEEPKEEPKKEVDDKADVRLPPPVSADIPGLDLPVNTEEEEKVEEKVKVEDTPVKPVVPASEEICDVPVVVDKKVEVESENLIKAVNFDADKIHEEIKKEFLGSALCAPEKVLNDPKDKLSPVLFNQLIEDMKFVVQTNQYLTRDIKIMRFKSLAEGYKLSSETIQYGEELLKNYADTNEGRFEAMARLRGVMLQDMAKVASSTEGYEAETIKEGLGQRGIFSADADGNFECPFVDKDAFRDALAGREAVLASGNASSITNPDIITIVDYTKPSNQRRMYVIDLKNKKVLHNTWVGQGGGTDRSQEQGSDGRGSNPKTSNASNSFLSSEGFYVATSASKGEKYLNNVILKGIDDNNSNMSSRGIVIHGWRTPSSEYVNRTWEMSSDAKNAKRLEGKDIYKEFMSLDFKTTKEDLFNITQDVKSAASGRDFVDATDGCLGVPDTKMGHTDRKGRDKSQLELLREDLPGTLMFNYTGKETKSKYLEK